MLESFAENHSVSRDFWSALRDAAARMGLSDRARKYERFATGIRAELMNRIFLYPYAGPGGRNYFKQIGTTQDVMLNGIKLEEGLSLSFYCEDSDGEGRPNELLFEGTVHCDSEKAEWYVIIDEKTYRHVSDVRNPLRRSK